MSAAQNNSSSPPPVKNALHTSSQVHPQPNNNNQQPQIQSHGNNINGGGLLYNNLIPGHYRYGATPPAPPVGPLSCSNISQSSQSSHQQHQQMNYKNTPNDLRQQNNNNYGSSQQPMTHQLHYNNVSTNNHTYANVPSTTTEQPINHNTSSNNNYADVFLEVSEPEDDFDDDLLVIASSDMMEEVDLDDEKYYKPFRHLGGSNGSVGTHNSQRSQSSSSSPRSKSSTVKTKKKAGKAKESTANNDVKEETKPMDILTVLLSGPAVAVDDRGTDGNTIDITIMIEEAATKSSRARSMTNALVLQEKEHPQQETNSDNKEDTVDNDLYVATANAHTEAAISFQRVYKKLLGLKNEVGATTVGQTVTSSDERIVGTLSQSEELAKSMIILSNGHARMAKSLGEMGVKWNMGKVDNGGRMVSKNSNDVNTTINNKKPTSTSKDSNDDSKRRESTTSNERLRMAVRGALDTANHEDDITNSTFLARSTVLNANKKLAASSKVPNKKDMKNKVKRGDGSGGGVNPVDDLMKLEKELRSMDMALEMGNSVASLGTAVASRPNNDLLGGSYMSSSSMWTSGIFGGRKSNPKQQQGSAGVRSRANHLQNFPGKSAAVHAPAANLSQQQQGVQITPNAALDQSWWGGGGGQGSILATTAVASNQRTQQQTLGSNQANASTNAKQLMQLMDSLNRLGNENAQLMREVEEAKAARAETEAAKQMMAQFKTDYNQRFNKVKEALEKYKHASGDNPVGNSAYVKSASALELQKKDQMIKKLAADLRKERSESKKKDTALRKYEGFYLEVKKRSAEKREQQQRQQQANAAANKAANKK